MSLIEHARAELARINFGDEDTSVMVDILGRFFDQWDSGGAVSCVAPLVPRLLAGQPLSPLTGEDDEWFEPYDGCAMLQNKRCGTVFKDVATGRANDIDAPDPQAPISFPYDPATREVQPPVFMVGEGDDGVE
jgi:hypothetical protein